MTNTLSIYAREFNSNCLGWENNRDWNLILLKMHQNYFNDKLKVRKKVFLNDVYETLGIPIETKYIGIGWDIDRDGDGFIDFGIFDHNRDDEGPNIMLDFNVDGQIIF